MRKSPKFSPEVVERAVRMVFDAKDQYPSQWAAIESIASKIGCTRASMQNETSMLIDTRCASTRRLGQSTMATRLDPAVRHRDVGDIRGLDVIGPLDDQPTQQVRVHGVPGVLLAGVGLAVQRLDAHPGHQRAHILCPSAKPSRLSMSRSMRLPANGWFRRNSSMRRISRCSARLIGSGR